MPTPARPRPVVAAERPSRLRRIATLSLPPLALLLLGWLGRHALDAPVPIASAASAASASASASSSISAAPADADADTAELGVSDAAAEAAADAARAIEALPDGAVIVDLNLASETDLRALPGVGPSRAKAIVALRQRLGRLRSVDDLARIKGFGRALVRRLRPLSKV
jgi:competence protein ComEA